jgi:5-methylcytosine-specific restriction endonuclease McrA
MNKYSQLLQDKRWKERRAEIIQRDGGKCQKCQSTEKLHVHHLWYCSGEMPWESSDDALVTLCHLCHYGMHSE